jgi:ribosome-binding protein aMBF1 (putative translation factor)
VWGRQSTNLDGRRSLLTLGDNIKEFPELIQGRRQYNIIRTGRDLKNWHSNDLADNLRINHNNMPCNCRL